MTALDPEAAAALLQELRQARRVIGKLPDGLAPSNEAEGIAIQHALALRMDAAQPAGFKIGATSARMQAYLGVAAPVAGFMVPAGIHASAATLSFADYLKPGVECELAVRLAADLPSGPCDLDRASAAVGALFCGVEIVENRYIDMKTVGVPTMAADQMFHAGAVLGDPGSIEWRNLNLVTLPGRMTVDGVVVGQGTGGDLLGHPLASLAWLAASPLAARFGGLRAGQVVMLGSVTPPFWLTGPCAVTVTFPPLPPVTVRFV